MLCLAASTVAPFRSSHTRLTLSSSFISSTVSFSLWPRVTTDSCWWSSESSERERQTERERQRQRQRERDRETETERQRERERERERERQTETWGGH